jgi:archaellum component FlaC
MEISRNPNLSRTVGTGKVENVRHREELEEQDERLNELASTVERLKNISCKIGDQIDIQGKIIDNLSDNVEKTDRNMKKVTKKVDDVHEKTRSTCVIS